MKRKGRSKILLDIDDLSILKKSSGLFNMGQIIIDLDISHKSFLVHIKRLIKQEFIQILRIKKYKYPILTRKGTDLLFILSETKKEGKA